jgi:hypothetical protein
MVSTEYVHVVSREELQRLLDVSNRGLDKLRRKGMPATTEPPEGKSGQWWSIAEIRRWIAANNIRKPQQMTPNWWPDATTPADYLGAELVHLYSSDREPAAVLQRWDTDSGEVVVAWEMTSWSVNGEDLAQWAPKAAAYVRVDTNWGLRGPGLSAWPASNVRDGKASISWGHLARVLGRPAPFWSQRLRVPELIQAWRPGDPPVRHPGQIGLDVQPLMRMALLYPVDHVAHRALVNTAQVIVNREGAYRDTDLKILAKYRAERPFHQVGEDQLEVAAIPADVDAGALPSETDPAIARVGWREIAHRTDRLAEQCMDVLARWDGGKNLPWAYTITIPHTPSGREFLNRLEPAQERTAIYAILDPDRRGRPMIDPLTDIPVILPADDSDEIRALAPQRLPATTPLAEVILENVIWVRTADGTLYPAPNDSYAGLSYGYSGSGPSTLAALIDALLIDITAKGADIADDAPDGLIDLMEQDWPQGTVLSREQLEAARDA